MTDLEKDKIQQEIENACKEEKNENEYLEVFMEIYNHICEHKSENENSRIQSVKKIIDKSFEKLNNK